MVVRRIDEHVETQHLLPDQKYAYRATYPTETAVIAVHNSIVRTIDSGDVCALVLLDLSSAFDTADHETRYMCSSSVLESKAQLFRSFVRTCVIKPKPFTTTHSSLDLTELTAVCHKCQC